MRRSTTDPSPDAVAADEPLLERFHRALLDEIRRSRPEYLRGAFSVAEIYQDLVPYRTHRDVIGVEMNGDYELALLRLLAGEGGYLVLDSDAALDQIRLELRSANPDPGLFRQFAALDVRLKPGTVAPGEGPASGDADPAGVPDAMAAPAAGAAGVTSAGPDADPGADPAAGPARSAPAASPVTEVAREPRRSAADPRAPAAAEGPAPAAPDRPASPADSARGPEASRPNTPRCHWCRAELPQRRNLRHCPFCGTSIDLVPCPECGEELERGWRFCIACGTEVRS